MNPSPDILRLLAEELEQPVPVPPPPPNGRAAALPLIHSGADLYARQQ